MDLTLPAGLSSILGSIQEDKADTPHLEQEDLEWLFFGALFHQFALFGGRTPVLDLSDDSLQSYEESGDFDLADIEEVSWPPIPSLKLDEMQPLIQLFSKYAETPKLWSAGVLHEQGEYLSLDVESLLELSLLQDRAVRSALIALIEAQDWGALQLVAGETCRMLGEKAIFRFPGDPE